MRSPNRRSLEAVPDPDLADNHEAEADFNNLDAGEDWRAQTVIKQWAPEHQLIGALMHLPAPQARPILEAVPDTAIWRPITRWAYELIRGLVDAGRNPDPVLVLRRAGTQSANNALHPDQCAPARRHHELAVYLADAYTQVVDPHDALHYAREVLDDTYRRAVQEHGIRMAQLAESGAETAVVCEEALKLAGLVEQWTGVSQTDLTGQFTAIRDELAELWRRADAAAQPDRNSP
jgi:replicative DNA helicase